MDVAKLARKVFSFLFSIIFPVHSANNTVIRIYIVFVFLLL
jgi:hypothetical protein